MVVGTGCDRPCGTTTTLHNVPLKVQVSVGHPHTVSHHTTGCNLSGTGCGSGCGGGCGGGYGGNGGYGKRSVVADGGYGGYGDGGYGGCGCGTGATYAGGCGCGCSGGYGANGGGVTGGALGAGVGTGALNTGLGTGCDRPCGTTTTLHNIPLKVQVSVGHPHTVSHPTTGCNLSGTGCGSGCGGGCGGGYGGNGGSYGKRSVVVADHGTSSVAAGTGC